MIDLDKFICSLLNQQIGQLSSVTYNHVQKALAEQGLEYKDGAIKSIERKPKFKKGDWVVYTGHLLKDSGMESYVMQVKSIEDGRYNFTDTSTLCFDSEKYMRLWTIQDGKPGDVLCTSEGVKPKIVFILKGTPKKHYALSYYCFYNIMYPSFETDEKEGCLGLRDEDVKPATKEQRDRLEKAITEAGYKWNADTLTLEKIEKQSTIRFNQLADNDTIRLKPIDFDKIDVDAMVERYSESSSNTGVLLGFELLTYRKGLEDMLNILK